MKPVKKVFESGQTILWIETQNTVAFLRPVPDILLWTPGPTAGLAQPLRFRQVRFTTSEGLLGPLLFTQIEYECDTLVPTSLKQRGTDQHRHAVPVFPEKLLLVWLNSPGSVQFCHVAFVALAPFRRRQIRPAHTTRDKIFTAVLHHAQKRFVGFDDRTFEVPDEDPQNVGVDQAPDLPFAILEIAIELRILERDCRLRRKHLQHRDAVRSENVWRQIVFKVENTDELGLVN